MNKIYIFLILFMEFFLSVTIEPIEFSISENLHNGPGLVLGYYTFIFESLKPGFRLFCRSSL